MTIYRRTKADGSPGRWHAVIDLPPGHDGKRRQKGLRPSTRVEYARHINNIFLPELGRLKLADLRPRHIEEVLTRLQRASEARRGPISAKTLRRILATLHSALSTAVTRGLLRRNPASTVELPKAERYQPKVWSKDQADRFLKATEDDPLGVLFRLLLLTGVRRGEVIGLQWGDLDVSERLLRIQRAITLVQGELLVGPPKSEAGMRCV